MTTVDDLNQRLDRLADPHNFEGSLRNGLDRLRSALMRFPPQPDRMRSGHLNTWVREVGRLPVSAFLKQRRTQQGTFTIARRRIQRNAGDVLQPSEKLLAEWKQAEPQVTVSADRVQGIMTNPVSYGPYVEGTEQTEFHAETGWPTIQQVQDQYRASILDDVRNQVVKLLRGSS